MQKIPPDKLRQLTDGTLPEDEFEELALLADDDPETRAAFDDAVMGSLGLAVGRMVTGDTDEQRDDPVGGADGEDFERFVHQYLGSLANSEWWSIEAENDRIPDLFTGKVAIEVKCNRRVAGQSWVAGSMSAGGDQQFPIAIEHTSNDPHRFRMTGLPKSCQVLSVQLTQLEHTPRETWEKRLTLETLGNAITRRQAAAEEQRAASSFSLGASTQQQPREQTPQVDHAQDFRVEWQPEGGEFWVSAKMPLDRSTDFVVCECDYRDLDGNPATHRQLLKLAPLSNDRRWSRDTSFSTNVLTDRVSEPEITIRLRSLHDSDLFLLPKDDRLELLSAAEFMPLPARATDDGKFEFSIDTDAELAAAKSDATCWSLEVVPSDKEVDHE